ncbi:hypothetical protein BG418_09120 [Streptomyces sp. CBMA152]|nr:hypothetical protein [Streptomyces sp. CBMA152]
MLRAAVPDAVIHEADALHAGGAYASVSVLVLRSGIRLGVRELDWLPRLRHVVRTGSGTDNIDLLALEQRGVQLHRNAAASAPSLAEWVLTAALALSRRLLLGHNAVLRGAHTKVACLAAPLGEMRVGIWGTGPVGLATRHALAPHTGRITFARWPSNPAGLPELPAETLVKECQLHVVAVPLRPETRGIIDSEFLEQAARVRPHLVCAGRLETLDVPACLRALADGHLSGLAVDGVEHEHLPLFRSSPDPLNLLITPHIGAQRADVRRRLDQWAADLLQHLFHPPKPTTVAVGGLR